MILQNFKVTNYRNIIDSGWIDVGDITAFVGQNEAGKSNLFEALYRVNPFAPGEAYNIDEDWPVDDWGNKDPSSLVCEARFTLTSEEIESLYRESGIKKTDAAIEDLFEDQFYIDCVNMAFGITINPEDLPVDGSDMITKRVETVLRHRYGHMKLDKRLVMAEILHRFDGWKKGSDLPNDTAARAEKLIKAVNKAFGEDGNS